jgi:molecular chaperone DnaK (HSP70)
VEAHGGIIWRKATESADVGGAHFTEILVRLLKKYLERRGKSVIGDALQRLRAACERAKCDSYEKAANFITIQLGEVFEDMDGRTANVQRSRFEEEKCAELFKKCMESVTKVSAFIGSWFGSVAPVMGGITWWQCCSKLSH